MGEAVEVINRQNSWREKLALLLHPHDGECDFCGHMIPRGDEIEMVAWARLSPGDKVKCPNISIPIPHPYRVCSQECFGCILRELTGEREVEWSVQ